MECSGAPNAVNEAAAMVKRGGKVCLAAFPSKPVEVDVAALVRNNISLFGIQRRRKKRSTQSSVTDQ